MSWQRYLDDHQARFQDELLEFLRIPSISSLPEHAPDLLAAARWVAARLERAGVEAVQVMEAGRYPMVYGEWLHAADAPTVLIYGHFDVQPVDPVNLWSHPPFEPHLADDRIYARGASDDKGNMLIPILAVEALLAEGGLPVNVKFLFEGQEEIGSPDLRPFLEAHRELLASDLILSADGGQFSEEEPALLLGLRGICALQLDVTGPSHDLHSGSYGGMVHNPIHALVQLLASMRAEDGRILVQGFYDQVRPLSDEERRSMAAVPFDEEAEKERLGVDAFFGEPGYTPLERRWARPTLELNGIWGGFQGEGTKTVLPAKAHAKITCRLVPDQDPAQVIRSIERHVAAQELPGVTAHVQVLGQGNRAYLMPADHPGNLAAKAVHQRLYGKEPYLLRSGGSIPFCTMMLEILGAYTVNFAFGLPDERAHAPDEFFRLSSFRRGQHGYGLLLHELAGFSR